MLWWQDGGASIQTWSLFGQFWQIFGDNVLIIFHLLLKLFIKVKGSSRILFLQSQTFLHLIVFLDKNCVFWSLQTLWNSSFGTQIFLLYLNLVVCFHWIERLTYIQVESDISHFWITLVLITFWFLYISIFFFIILTP